MFPVAILTSMLLAFSAHAQEVTRTSAPKNVAPSAAGNRVADGDRLSVAVATTTPVPDRPSRRSASTSAGRPDAEVEQVAPNRQALHMAHPPAAKRHLDKRFVAAGRVGCWP